MKLKTSSGTKKVGIIFLCLAVVCVVLAVVDMLNKGDEWVMNFTLMLFCAVLWVACGIIVLSTAKKQKEEEAKKVKISAFNYAKAGKKK